MSKVGTPLNQVLDLNPFTELLSPNEFDPIQPRRIQLGSLLDYNSELPVFEAIQRPPYIASLNHELLHNGARASKYQSSTSHGRSVKTIKFSLVDTLLLQ